MKISKLISVVFTIVTLITFNHVARADYQYELVYSNEAAELDDKTDINYAELGLSYYFQNVKTDDRPLVEAPYLQRVSSFSAYLIDYDVDYPDTDKRTGDGLGVNYSMMNPGSDFILEVMYETTSGEHKFSSGVKQYDVDITSKGLGIGFFIDQTTSVSVTVIKTDVEYAPYSYANYDTTDTFLSAKSVMMLGGGTALNLEGLFGKNDYHNGTNTVYGVGADYYFTNKISIGGTYLVESGDEETAEGTTTSLNGRVFVTPNLSLALQVISFDADLAGEGYDETDLEVRFRF